jgi:hypothetical protein
LFEADGSGLEITDKVRQHTFRHTLAGLWEMTFIDTKEPGTRVVVTPACHEPLSFTKSVTGSTQTLTLRWPSQRVDSNSEDQFRVSLTLTLEGGAETAEWKLNAESEMTRYSFWSGSITLGIEEDGGQDHFLLNPVVGYLTKNPATTLPPPETPFDCLIRSVAQVTAFYDAKGNGLYVAGADGTGDYANNFRFSGDGQRTRITFDHYSEDTLNPARDFSMPYPVKIGRFRGDWYDAADRYRTWLEGTEIASRGPLHSREDIPESVKEIQQVIVLGPLENYFFPGGFDLAGRIEDYRNHYGLERVRVMQFSPVWAEGNELGVGKYDIDSAWLPNLQVMKEAGSTLDLYMLDNYFHQSHPSYLAEGWDLTTLRDPAGEALSQSPPGPDPGPYALIDPSTDKWLQHMDDLGEALGQEGVGGMYLDNFFPERGEHCFSVDHGHLPGFGSYLTRGFSETFSRLRAAARKHVPDFITTTEVTFEGYLRDTDMMLAVSEQTDLVSADERTVGTDLYSFLYHHLVALGPVNAGGYVQPQQVSGGFPTVWNVDPVISHVARRGAFYTLAFGWVGGYSIWSPDIAWYLNPGATPLAFEIPVISEQVVEYRAVNQWAADLAKNRTDALGVGKRLRNLELNVPTVSVLLQTSHLGKMELAEVPAVVNGVWEGPDGEISLVLANHGELDPVVISFEFDPAAYGLGDSVRIFDRTTEWATIEGKTTLLLEMPAESVRVLRVVAE